MYTLAYSDNDPNFARVFYTTACGTIVIVAYVEFLENRDSTVTVELMGGKLSLGAVKGIYDVVKLELDTRKDS